MKKVRIADRWIGGDEPIFIVVETGTTCNGSVETALRMVDAAKEVGADAIKFMIIGPEYFMSDTTVTYEYEWAGGQRSENMFEMFKGLLFSPEEWIRIRDHCREREIIFYATVDYLLGVDLAEQLEVPAYKLSSWDTRHFPLIQRMAQTGKPLEIDLGPNTLSDVEKMLQVIHNEGNDQVILVHCSHAKNDADIHIRTVPYLQQVFGLPVGYSADSRDFVPDLMAVALGTNLIEKRMTLDLDYEGHHHIKALEPDEFKEYVAMIRRAEAIRGNYLLKPSAEDLRQKELYFVSLVADVDIPAGTTITRQMLACKRPGSGIAPEFIEIMVGRKAQRDIKRNELLSWDQV
jgi:N-acetylneuraminate synthase/N,N'-diacetyllegionaminate synthase